MRKALPAIIAAAVTAACFLSPLPSTAACGCDLAFASYYLSPNVNLTFIDPLFGVSSDQVVSDNGLQSKDSIIQGTRLSIRFRCDCLSISGAQLSAGNFSYTTNTGDTYTKIANSTYANLTTAEFLSKVNSYPANNIPPNRPVNVVVNCSCGDARVSTDYGLFETYPLRPEDNITSIAVRYNLTGKEDLLTSYNPGINFSAGTGIVFIPRRDPSGSYRPLTESKGISGGVIAGIVIAVLVVMALLAICLYFRVYKKKSNQAALLPSTFKDDSVQNGSVISATSDKVEAVAPQGGSAMPLANFTVDKSVEFSYEELAKATNDFSLSNKIGSGGFGTVYYAELRGEKVAIKKMDMEASREFLAELKVLTHVHHLNLVRLIGYCTEGSLFLVYEFIDNGNLSEHLRGVGRDPLPWAARVQIALDSARGLEYIHEHTVPMYIHRDIKSANILIDKNCHAKVADFGLAKLTEVGSSLQTRLVGTFGYMPPEYAQYGDVSPKVDVYAFGVVLYELISAKEAVMKAGSVTESRGLVATFEDALSKPDPREELRKIVDPRLGDNYPIEAVYKTAQLAKACTQERPEFRPSMRSVVVALMTLSSSTEDWDVGSFYENQALMNLMSGR